MLNMYATAALLSDIYIYSDIYSTVMEKRFMRKYVHSLIGAQQLSEIAVQLQFRGKVTLTHPHRIHLRWIY